MPSSRRQFLSSLGLVFTGGTCGTSVVDAVDPSLNSNLDWPMARYDPAGTGHHPTASGPTGDIAIQWTHDAPDWFLGTTSLIRHGTTLYAVGNGLLALDSNSGDRRFEYAGPYQSSPAVVPASAYNTDTLAVTASSGVFGLHASGGFTIPLLDHTIGAERWTNPQSTGGGFFGPEDADTPVTANGAVYTALPGTNSVVALNPNNGQVQWRRTHHEDDPVSAEINRPAVKDGFVFVTNWPKQAAAYRAGTGERQWLVELDDQLLLPPVATDQGVVVPSREFVYLLDPIDGSEVWRYSTDGNATESTPAVADGTIFVADEQESLHAIALETGQQRWTAPFDGPTTPVIADGIVYAVKSGYALIGIDAESGETLFEYRPSQVPLSTPIVGDGVLYAANRERVLALEEAT